MRELDAYDFLVCSLPQRLSQVQTAMLDELIREHNIPRSKDNGYLRSRQDKCTALALHGSRQYQDLFRASQIWKDLEAAQEGRDGIQKVIQSWGLKKFQNQLTAVKRSLATRKNLLEARLTEIEQRVRAREDLERAMLARADAMALESPKERRKAMDVIDAQVEQLRENEVTLWKQWKELVRKRVVLERLTETLVKVTEAMVTQLATVGKELAKDSAEASELARAETQLASMQQSLENWSKMNAQKREFMGKTSRELRELRETVSRVRGEISRSPAADRGSPSPRSERAQTLLRSVQDVSKAIETIEVDPLDNMPQEEWVKYPTSSDDDVSAVWVQPEEPITLRTEKDAVSEDLPADLQEDQATSGVAAEPELETKLKAPAEPQEVQEKPKERSTALPSALVASAEEATMDVREAAETARKEVEEQRTILREQWKALQQLWIHLESLEDTAEMPEEITAEMLQAKTEEVLSRAMKIHTVLEETEDTLSATQQMLHMSDERYQSLQHQLMEALRSLLEPNVLANYPQNEDLEPTQALEDLVVYLSKQKQWKGQFERLSKQFTEMQEVHRDVLQQVTVWLKEELEAWNATKDVDEAWNKTQSALQSLETMVAYYKKSAGVPSTPVPPIVPVVPSVMSEESPVKTPVEPAVQASVKEPTVEMPKEPVAVQTSVKEPTVEMPEEPAVVEVPEESAVVEVPEESAVVEVPEEPAVVETPEELVITETPEEPAVVETPEEPAVVETPEVPLGAEEVAPRVEEEDRIVESRVVTTEEMLQTEGWTAIPVPGPEEDRVEIVKKIRQTRDLLVEYARHEGVFREFPKNTQNNICPAEGTRIHSAPGRGDVCVPDTDMTSRLEAEIQRLVTKLHALPRRQEGGAEMEAASQKVERLEMAPVELLSEKRHVRKKQPSTPAEEAVPTTEESEAMLVDNDNFQEAYTKLRDRLREETNRLRELRTLREKHVLEQASTMRRQIEAMTKDVEAMGSMYEKQVAHLNVELKAVTAREAAVQDLLATAEARLRVLQDELQRALMEGARVGPLEKQVAEYIATVERLRSDLDTALTKEAEYRKALEKDLLKEEDARRLREGVDASKRKMEELQPQEEHWSEERREYVQDWKTTWEHEIARAENLLSTGRGTTLEVTELLEHLVFLEEQLTAVPKEETLLIEWKQRLADSELRWKQAREDARAEVESMIEELRTQLLAKTARLTELEEAWKTSENTRSQLAESYDALREEHQGQSFKFQTMQEELEGLKKTADELATVLQWSETQTPEELKERWAAMRQAQRSLETELRMKSEHASKLEEILTKSRQGMELDAMVETLKESEDDRRNLMVKVVDGQAKVSELSYQAQMQEEELKTLMERLKAEQQRYGEMEDQFSKTMKEYEQAYKEDMEKQRAQLKAFVEEEAKLKEAAEVSLRKTEEERARMNNDLQRMDRGVGSLLEYYQQAQKMIDERDTYIQDQLASVQKIREQMERMTEERTELVDALEKERKDHLLLQEKRKTWQSELEALEKIYRDETHGLSKALGESRTQALVSDSKIKVLEAQAEDWNAEYKKQQQALGEAMGENRKLSRERTALLEAQVQLEKENTEIQQKNQSMRNEMTELNVFMNKLNRDMERLVGDADGAEKQLARHAMLSEAQRLVWKLHNRLESLHPDAVATSGRTRSKLFIETMDGLLALYQVYGDKDEKVEVSLQEKLTEARNMAKQLGPDEAAGSISTKFMEFVVTLDGGWFQSPITSRLMRAETRKVNLNEVLSLFGELSDSEKTEVIHRLNLRPLLAASGDNKVDAASVSAASSSSSSSSSSGGDESTPFTLTYGGGAASVPAPEVPKDKLQDASAFGKAMFVDLASDGRKEDNARVIEAERKRLRYLSEESRKKLQSRLLELETKMARLRSNVSILQTAAAAAAQGEFDEAKLLEAVEKLLHNAEFMRVTHENNRGVYEEFREELIKMDSIIDMHHEFQNNLRKFILGYRASNDPTISMWHSQYCLVDEEMNKGVYTKLVEPLYVQGVYMDPLRADELFEQYKDELTSTVVYQALHRASVAHALLGSTNTTGGSLSQLVTFMNDYGSLLQTDLLERLLEVL